MCSKVNRNSQRLFTSVEMATNAPSLFGPLKPSLRKHAYSNILKILPPKNKNFQIKILIFFHVSAKNIDCGYSLEPPRRGDSNEYPQYVCLGRNKKNN